MATMSKVKIAQIRKRDGSIVPFDARKIEDAIFKAPAAALPAPAVLGTAYRYFRRKAV